MRVREFQDRIRDLYLSKDQSRGTEGTFLWLVEEVGELSVALRGKSPRNLADELADVIAWTTSLANLHDVDLEEALARKYPDACVRCAKRPCACPES